MKDKEFSGGGREFSSPGREFSDPGREWASQPPEADRSGREYRQESAPPAKPEKKKRRRAFQPAALTAAVLVTTSVALGPAFFFGPSQADQPSVPSPTQGLTPEPPAEEDPSAYIGLTRSDGDDFDFSVYEPITLYFGSFGEYMAGLDLNGYHILSHETLLTVSNLANAEDNCYITISLNRCDKDQDGRYINSDEIYTLVLTNSGGFVSNLLDLDDNEFGGPVELRPGESLTLSLSEYDENDLLVLRAELHYPDLDQYWWKGYGFVIDDEPSPEPTPAGGQEGDIIASGNVTESVTWTLHSDGTLAIDGTGGMASYFAAVSQPWRNYHARIETVVIGDGVTGIGDTAFRNCGVMTGVTIPASVTSIASNAFIGCGSLTDVYYGGSEEQWEQISIGRSNEPLLNAAIHYNGGPR